MKAKRSITPEQAQAKLEALCARAEHSTGELTDRLRRWGVGSSDSEKILASLKAHRFVDDKRFTKAYVADKLKFARWGKRKIYQGLIMKRVAPQIIKETLADIDPEVYEDTLESVLLIKIASNPELLDSYEGRTRLFRFAASRGFEPQLCSKVLSALIKKQTEAK